MRNPRIRKPLATAVLAALSLTSTISAADEPADLAIAKDQASEVALTVLTEQEQLDRSDIQIVNVSIIDWPDSSLGCPKPGMEYLQVVTRGAHVLLKTEEKVYRVHTAGERGIICEGPARPTSGLSDGNKPAGAGMREVMLSARQDLAATLGVEVADVTVTRIDSTTWPNEALGCPAHGQQYEAKEIRGYKLTLNHDGRNYTYHTDQESGFPCPAIANN